MALVVVCAIVAAGCDSTSASPPTATAGSTHVTVAPSSSTTSAPKPKPPPKKHSHKPPKKHHPRAQHRAGPAWTVAQARHALPKLRTRGFGSMAAYSRERFGPDWADVNHNGCDTRNDILNRDLVHRTWVYSDHCEVKRAILHDPYTGRTIHFKRGVGSSLAVQIDHMVALGDAWQTGARGWSAARRERFANDPRELIAVSGSSNEAKGDDDAAEWLPPRRAFDCQYAADQVMIKRTYGLWVTPAEKHALAAALARC